MSCSRSSLHPALVMQLQAAVPKYILLQLHPASGTVLGAAGSAPVTQRITLTNTQHGTKGLAMRLRINFKDAQGQPTTEMAEVTTFPPGL